MTIGIAIVGTLALIVAVYGLAIWLIRRALNQWEDLF